MKPDSHCLCVSSRSGRRLRQSAVRAEVADTRSTPLRNVATAARGESRRVTPAARRDAPPQAARTAHATGIPIHRRPLTPFACYGLQTRGGGACSAHLTRTYPRRELFPAQRPARARLERRRVCAGALAHPAHQVEERLAGACLRQP